jgi:hypothetical protein
MTKCKHRAVSPKFAIERSMEMPVSYRDPELGSPDRSIQSLEANAEIVR